MNRFFIVRHGDTFEAGEKPRRIGAKTDLPLVANGREQARHLGVFFAQRGVVFDRALSATSRRATETAALILAVQRDSPPLEETRGLDEVDHGPDEGELEEKVVARLGCEALARWDKNGEEPSGWRVQPSLRRRYWRMLLRGTRPCTTLLVTSNGSARFALLAHPHLAAPTLKLRTGAYGELIRPNEGDLSIRCWDVRPARSVPDGGAS